MRKESSPEPSDPAPALPRVRLAPLGLDEVRAQIAALSAEERAQVSPRWLEALARATAADPWVHGFRILREDGAPVGHAGFKGPPDAEGRVEIAYGLAPEHRGRGYATAAARALIAWARAQAPIRGVRAHTLPEASASTRVLARCGFVRVGEVADPEDGPVWRWELREDPARGR